MTRYNRNTCRKGLSPVQCYSIRRQRRLCLPGKVALWPHILLLTLPHRRPGGGGFSCLWRCAWRCFCCAWPTWRCAPTPATGFVRDSGFALRLAAPLAAALVNWLLARKAAPRPAALLGACPPLGYCLLATGVALGAAALPCIGATRWPRGATALRWWCCSARAARFRPCGSCGSACGAFAPLADPTAPLPGTLNTLAGAAFFLCALVLRFTVEAASVQRLGCTLRVLSAVMALVFLLSLFRVFLTPGLPVGKKLYAAGFNAFLFCTCHELPQACGLNGRGGRCP